MVADLQAVLVGQQLVDSLDTDSLVMGRIQEVGILQVL
jgi:hypothetical protein